MNGSIGPLRRSALLPLCAIWLACLPLAASDAQATVRGVVLAGPSRTPVSGATVSTVRGDPTTFTDSLGRFSLRGVPMGDVRVVSGAPGFRPETLLVELDVDNLEVSAIVLQPAVQALSGVTVTGERTTLTNRISGFEERRKFGNGTFLDRSIIEKFEGRQTADILAARAPGVSIRRGTSRKAWAASGRAVATAAGVFGQAGRFVLDPSDRAAGARPACYMDTYLNGALVYDSKAAGSGNPIPLFDINSISPEQIESIEAYTSSSQIPAQYNRTSGGCGVLIIWTRS